MNDLKNMGKVTEVKVEDNVPPKAKSATNVDFDETQYDSNSTNHSTIFYHGFNELPSRIMIYFTPDETNFYPLMWFWDANYSGGPVTIKVTDETITLQIFDGTPLFGAWVPTTGWTKYNSGYWKVLAWK